MNNPEKSSTGKKSDENLVTERDIDDKFGLFEEDSFPGSLPDNEQQAAINHAVPKEEKQ